MAKALAGMDVARLWAAAPRTAACQAKANSIRNPRLALPPELQNASSPRHYSLPFMSPRPTAKFAVASHILEKYHEIRQRAIFCASPWAERGGAA
ncbi:hypothetical protein [Belnapia rosea]|uniref:hypothetical protein n=1 Tax=Belnapia rosea TaxID=938405 RepID=UPI0015A34B81|nr:hypothetical protein [Belnapia rosea]